MLTLPFVLLTGCCLPSGTDGGRPAAPDDPEQSAARAVHKSLGVEFALLESRIRRSIIRTRTPYGFKISKVGKGSAAARAGWQEGDVLLEWDGQPVKTVAGLAKAVREAKKGAAVKFKLARRKKDASIWSRQPWQHVEGQLVPK